MAELLTVDDERSIRELIKRFLKASPHVVREADTSDGALAALLERPADVVFVDVKMPGKDGLWLTDQIRARHPKTAVILVTGTSTIPARTSMQAGVVAYLVKPFSSESVNAALNLALIWAAAAQAAEAKPANSGATLTAGIDSLDKKL